MELVALRERQEAREAERAALRGHEGREGVELCETWAGAAQEAWPSPRVEEV